MKKLISWFVITALLLNQFAVVVANAQTNHQAPGVSSMRHSINNLTVKNKIRIESSRIAVTGCSELNIGSVVLKGSGDDEPDCTLNASERQAEADEVEQLFIADQQAREQEQQSQKEGDDPAFPEADDEVSEEDVILDVTQLTLDIIGIVEPTPIADGANTAISLARGDFLGAGLSALSIVPYVGDLAKAGKLGKWMQTIANALQFAGKNKTVLKGLQKLADLMQSALKKVADVLPNGIKNFFKNVVNKVGNIGKKGDNASTNGKVANLNAPGLDGKKVRVNNSVDGRSIDRRLSVDEMRALQKEHGTEFAQIYVAGKGKNGGGGQYVLLQGNADTVPIPVSKDIRLINHTHPEKVKGNYVPLRASKGDQDVLRALQRSGSPQKKSQVVPETNDAFQFDTKSTKIKEN